MCQEATYAVQQIGAYSITLVGARKQRDGRVEAQRFGSPEIYNSFEFGWIERSPGFSPLRMRSTYDAARR
jgi:hypothetical protein